MTNHTYGRVLRAKRYAMGYTQAEFGKLVGVAGSTISLVENDQEVKETTIKAIKSVIRDFEDRLSGTALANYKLAVQYDLFCTSTTADERRHRLHKLMINISMALIDMDKSKEV